jgi:hypothetical protein
MSAAFYIRIGATATGGFTLLEDFLVAADPAS